MTQPENKTDLALETMFDAARTAEPIPSGDLMARILADAAKVQANTVTNPQKETPLARGFWPAFGDIFGGWAGASALAACVGLGLYVGFVSPDVVMSFVPYAEAAISDDGFGLFLESDF